MKTRSLIFSICVLFLSSCVVKSLHPFFTKNTISYDEAFIGEWIDHKGGKWKVFNFVDEITEDNPPKKMTKEDLKIYNLYKESYFIKKIYRNKEVLFIATPFKVKNQTFLDFYPLFSQESVTNLLESHLIYTHSLVKYDVKNDGKIEIRWLDEDKIKSLFKENRIKIKHEKMGIDNDSYLLTAKPKELQDFIKKYMASSDSEKWKTDTKFTLSKINAAN